MDIKTNLDYFKLDNLRKISCKIAKIIEGIKTNPEGIIFIYSQFRQLEGVGIFSMVLEANGYAPFRIRQSDGEWEQYFNDEEDILILSSSGSLFLDFLC